MSQHQEQQSEEHDRISLPTIRTHVSHGKNVSTHAEVLHFYLDDHPEPTQQEEHPRFLWCWEGNEVQLRAPNDGAVIVRHKVTDAHLVLTCI